MIRKDRMFYRFAAYGFLKNLRLFEPFLILIFRDVGLTFFQIGLLYSVRDLSNNILEIPTGVFADTFGRRKSMVLAFLSYILSFIVFYTFMDFHIYILAMILFGFGEAFRSGTHKALILEHLRLNDMEDKKVAYYGRTRSASQMGSAINAILAATLLFFSGDYRTMFLATTIPYVIDLINLATYPKILDGDLQRVSAGSILNQIRSTINDFVGIFRRGPAMKAIVNSASYTALFKAVKDYLQPILEGVALGLPILLFLENTKRSGLVIGLVYFIIYLLTSRASRYSDEVSRRFDNLAVPINLTFLIGNVFLIVTGLATWLHLTIVSIVIFLGFYVLQNLRKPMNVAFISDQISSSVMASGLSIETQLVSILVAVLAPLIGALADAFGVGIALTFIGAGTLLFYFPIKVKAEISGNSTI
jgi:MFS family permease